MAKKGDCIVGWIDSSINAVLRNANLTGRFRYVLVTSIDSSRDLPSLPEPQAIVKRYAGAGFLGDGLLLPSGRVAEVTSAFNLFTGFDEVWCFDHLPPRARPDRVSLVAPLDLSTDTLSSRVLRWMQESRCRLGLGDGIGLNFVTPDDTIAQFLRAASTA